MTKVTVPKIIAEHQKKHEEQHAKVRSRMTPQQLAISDQVAAEVEKQGSGLLDTIDQENELRDLGLNIIGRKFTVTELEELSSMMKTLRPGSTFLMYFKTFDEKLGTQVTRPMILIKTATGQLDVANNYIFHLERTIIDLVENQPKDQFTSLGFFGLIKLAFARLFKRRK